MELRRQFLVRCNVYPTLRRIAKDLGITYVTGYTKEGLVDAILNCEFPQQPVLNPPLPLNLLPPLMNNLPLQPYEQHPVLQQPEPVFHNPQLQQPALPPQQARIDHIVRDMSLGIPELTIEDLIHNDLTNVTGSIVTFDLTAVTPLPSGLEEQTTIGGRGYLLLRETNITHIKRIVKEAKQQFDTYKNITFAGHLIRGFAGIGKSSNMYLIARCCREDGWAIIYLPAFASLASSDKEAAACRFLDSLKRNNMEQTLRRIPVEEGRTLFEVLEQKSAFSNELAKDVIQILIRQEELPVLIAIDQWNSIFRVKEMENTHFLHQFRTFDSLKSPSTVVLTAVSATSPWKIEGFVDAQATIYSSNLPKFKPYDDTEWERILRYTRQRANMEHLPEHLIEEVKRCSGRLPRLLFMFLQSCQNEGFADCLTDFKDKSTNEYISKITSLIDAVPESAKKKIYNTIGALWLGIALDPTFVPVDLYAFMIKENGVCKPVCDIARDALFKVIEKDMDGIIELLVQDPDFSWRAFELFFASRLQRTDPLTFTTAPLLKNSRQQQRQYTLNIGQIEKFSRNDAGLHQNQWIRRGSVIVCYRAFPVVDLVVYNSDGHLFLFQLSMQSYASHSTGVYDLLNKNVGQIPVLKWIVEQLKDPPGDLSRVVNHWIENRANGHPCTFSHTHLHYVYVSVEDPRCERGDRSGDPVEVVFGRQLLDFGKQAELFWKGRE